MGKLRVFKFGGTSVGSGERIRHVARTIASAAVEGGGFPVVVVSALSGVTDALLRIARLVCLGKHEAVTHELDELKQRHIEAALQALSGDERREAVLVDLAQSFSVLEAEIARLPQFYQAHPYDADAASVAAWGERLSALLLAAAVEDAGARATAIREEVIITCAEQHAEPAAFGVVVGADPLLEATQPHVAALLHPLLRQGIVPVVPGFIGRTSSGMVKTLGRGGSDLSATVIAAALDACSEVVIFTDVDGVLSADPRLVGAHKVRLLPHLSYTEASQLARLGAQVLHPQTLAPLTARRLPVQVRNTFRPSLQGTVIGPEEEQMSGAKALVLKEHLALITIGPLLTEERSARATALAVALDEGMRPVAACSTFCQHLSLLIEERESEAAVAAFQQEGGWDMSCRRNLCACVCIGSGFSIGPRYLAEATSALARKGIELIAQSMTAYGLLLVVEEQEGERALHCLHDALIVSGQLAVVGS